MKKYILYYEDKAGNTLQEVSITAENIKEARKQRDASMATTRLNDVYKIKIKKA